MWIQSNHEPHFGNHIKIQQIDEPVHFSENGKANVKEQIAKILCDEIDVIEQCETEDDNQTKEDSED